jgi:hypothetical protein
MGESPVGLEGALRTFLGGAGESLDVYGLLGLDFEQGEQELCHCGEHYVGEDLRTQIPPLFVREWNEIEDDEHFFTDIQIMHNLTAFEHGDMLHPVWQVSQEVEIDSHTLILWAVETMRDVRFLALGLSGEGEELSFYTQEVLYTIAELNPGEAVALNVSFLHYLIPRFGITFLDESGEIKRMFVSESMRGGCFPLFVLGLHDETHFMDWAD